MRFWVTVLATGALAAAVSSPVLADVKAGVEAWQRGDYAAAIAEWRPLADQGDADAQFNLGQAYKLGRGVPADLDQAREWYRRAALQGHRNAEELYGLALHQKGERDTAVPWLDRAASRGAARAQFVLGTMYFNGEGVARDWVRAYALIQRAGEAGLAQAPAALKRMDQYLSVQERQRGLALAATLPGGRKSDMTGDALPVRSAAKAASSSPAPARTAAPARPAAATTASPLPVQGRWQVQLGAFSDAGNARTLWRNLSGRVPALAGRSPTYAAAGSITRLRAGPYASAADAGRACAAVKAAGSACLPVGP